MSVLIKGMDMPKHLDINGDHDSIFRSVIVVHKDGTAEFVVNLAGESTFARCNNSHLERFPCIEVPTPHGRLIDADKLIEAISSEFFEHGGYYGNNYQDIFDLVCACINDAQTIFEAEGDM